MARLFSLLICVLIFSCSSNNEKSSENKVKKRVIAVVNYPLYYFAKTVGGELITVYLPSNDGDPAYWKLDAKQVINFQKADVILANGAGYAKWMEKVSLPSSKIVNTSMSFKDQWIEINEGLAHSHGAEGDHVHKGIAFTTWLNFKLAAKQAEAVYQSIVTLLPGHVDELKNNYDQLLVELNNLDKRMIEIAPILKKQQVMTSHPVYQYLESGYEISMSSKHWEPDDLPTDEQWNDLEETMNNEKLNIMIWEDQPMESINSKLKSLNIIVAVFNPCANNQKNGNFMYVMDQNLNNLERVIKNIR